MSDQMIRLLLGQGAFGIVAALFVWLYVYEKSEHKTSREKHTAAVTQHNTQLKETYERLAREKAELVEQLNELREEHAQQQRGGQDGEACLDEAEGQPLQLQQRHAECAWRAATLQAQPALGAVEHDGVQHRSPEQAVGADAQHEVQRRPGR